MTSELNAEKSSESGYSRFGHVALAITIGVSVTGFLVGVRERGAEDQAVSLPVDHSAAVASPIDKQCPPVVVGYMEMNQAPRGPNANWHNDIPHYKSNPTVHYGSASPTPEQRLAALQRRGERRAFSGAPPVVPHSIDQRNAQACLVCHGAGIKIGVLVAPKMSHHMMANCTQCHVEMQQGWLASSDEASGVESHFVGLPEPGAGDRIGPGAPPTIPHPLWMRSECSSCHGSLGREGLRSSHPWRTNCTQCHAPSRGFDWSPLEEPPWTPPRRPKEPVKEIAGALAR